MNDIHNIPQPYQCDQCLPKINCYASKNSLDSHIRNFHLKIRNWKCKLCPKAFFDKQVLLCHQRVHDGKKPFQCNQCKMRFTQGSSLKLHIKNTHLKQRNYKCSYCGKRCATKSELRSHAAAVHNDAASARFE